MNMRMGIPTDLERGTLFREHIKRCDSMNIKEIVMKLSPEETLRLTRIHVDEDREEAMLFLKECLNLNWTRQPGTTERLSLRLRISLPRKMILQRNSQ
jgi:hypothetical protein